MAFLGNLHVPFGHLIMETDVLYLSSRRIYRNLCCEIRYFFESIYPHRVFMNRPNSCRESLNVGKNYTLHITFTFTTHFKAYLHKHLETRWAGSENFHIYECTSVDTAVFSGNNIYSV
jgi:hypothetical protein